MPPDTDLMGILFFPCLFVCLYACLSQTLTLAVTFEAVQIFGMHVYLLKLNILRGDLSRLSFKNKGKTNIGQITDKNICHNF